MNSQKTTMDNGVEILVVEDSPTQAEQLRHLLEDSGYTVISAANGKQALAAVQERKPALIVSDIVMPEMDGYELCRHLKADESLKEIPVILLTALSDPREVIKGLGCGADNFVTKPYSEKFLVSRIRNIFANQELRKERISQISIEIFFAGQKHLITSDRLQILDLLLSSFENAVQKSQELDQANKELIKTQLELKILNEELEERVKERTRRIECLNLLLRSIRDVNQLIVKENDRDRLIQGACDNLIKTRGYYGAWLALIEENGRVETAVQAGIEEGFPAMIDKLKQGEITWCIRRAIEQPEVVVLAPGAVECGDCHLAGTCAHKTRAMARLEYKGRVYGFLTVTIPAERAMDEEERSLFGEVAGDIAFALYSIEVEARRKKAEKALKESQQYARGLIEASLDSLVTISAEGKITGVNHATELITGLSRKEIIGTDFSSYFSDPDAAKRVYQQAFRDNHVQDYSLEIKHRDGRVAPVLCNASIYKDAQGRAAGVFAAARDITEFKRAEGEKGKLEDQLQQAQKMEAIGTLAGGIAHDFNNILTAVIGFTEIAAADAPQGSSLERNLQQVLKAGTRAKDLVKQILTFSRQTEQELRPVQVRLVAREALKLLRASLPTTIEMRQDIRSDSAILADPTQIHQILMNLCTNAGHAMQEKGGILEVSLADVELGPDFTAGHPDISPGHYLKLTVSDTGHGMDPSTTERIFDPYFTTKDKGGGTGLGLSVVHGIVESCGGTITVYSEPGKGTVFHVYLPIIEREAEPEVDVEEKLATGTERILFIDDEQLLVNMGRQMLESLGYKVVTRTSSFEALELFKKQRDKFDLVITDMTMPGMTGEELAKDVLKVRPDIPVLLCTGFSATMTEEKAKAIGIRAFVMKPFLRRDMAKIIRKVLDDN